MRVEHISFLDFEKRSGPELLTEYGVVVFDLDNTVIDSWPEAVEKFKEIIRLKNQEVDLTDIEAFDGFNWNQFERWAIEFGFSQEEAKSIEREVWTDQEMLRGAKPIEGALELIEDLMDSDIEIRFITSRQSNQEKLTEEWLEAHLKNFKKEMLYVRKESDARTGSDFKGETLLEFSEEFGGVVYIEDFPEHAKRILEIGKNQQIYVVLTPFNVPETQDFENIISARKGLIRIKREQDQGLGKVRLYLFGG